MPFVAATRIVSTHVVARLLGLHVNTVRRRCERGATMLSTGARVAQLPLGISAHQRGERTAWRFRVPIELLDEAVGE